MAFKNLLFVSILAITIPLLLNVLIDDDDDIDDNENEHVVKETWNDVDDNEVDNFAISVCCLKNILFVSVSNNLCDG